MSNECRNQQKGEAMGKEGGMKKVSTGGTRWTGSKKAKVPTILHNPKAPTAHSGSKGVRGGLEDVRALQEQGLKAINMLDEMNAMLDMQVGFEPSAFHPPEPVPKPKKKEAKASESVRDIQSKNKEIRSILDHMGSSSDQSQGYGHLLRLEAVFDKG